MSATFEILFIAITSIRVAKAPLQVVSLRVDTATTLNSQNTSSHQKHQV
jgi:hypothetical protein